MQSANEQYININTHHHHNSYNPNQKIFKIVLTGLFLTLSTILSLIEIKFYLPWGVEMDLRLFDMVFLFLSVTVLGVYYASIAGLLQPWFHLAVDGDHSAISILFYSISNVLIIIIFWFLYLKVFSFAKYSKLKNSYKKELLYFLFFVIFIFLAASIDSFFIIIVSKITLVSSDNIINFSKFKNLFILYLIFLGIFIVKYLVALLIFISINRKSTFLQEHYNN